MDWPNRHLKEEVNVTLEFSKDNPVVFPLLEQIGNVEITIVHLDDGSTRRVIREKTELKHSNLSRVVSIKHTTIENSVPPGRRRAHSKASMVQPSPENIGRLLSYLVPRMVRAKCFEPFLEDLKADRAEKVARTASRRVKRWIECCFYFRLVVTVIQSLVCYLGDLLAKIAPFIRALFFR